MEGWIYVVDNPYYAVTGVDGKFTIPDVPAGNYMLVAVQPLTGPMQQTVVRSPPQADRSDNRTEEEIDSKQVKETNGNRRPSTTRSNRSKGRDSACD